MTKLLPRTFVGMAPAERVALPVRQSADITRLTIDLPDELERELAAAAQERNWTESDVVLDLLHQALNTNGRRQPTFPLFEGDAPDLAKNFDKYLKGFGQS